MRVSIILTHSVRWLSKILRRMTKTNTTPSTHGTLDSVVERLQALIDDYKRHPQSGDLVAVTLAGARQKGEEVRQWLAGQALPESKVLLRSTESGSEIVHVMQAVDFSSSCIEAWREAEAQFGYQLVECRVLWAGGTPPDAAGVGALVPH